MTLLTVDELREHVATTLPDTALQRLLNDAEDAIVAFGGVVASEVELVDGGVGLIATSRPIGSITSIIERAGLSSPVTLAANDYQQTGRYLLRRLTTGTNSALRWRDPVQVSYVAEDDTDTREIVQLELVRIEISFTPGLASETVGSWTQTYVAGNKTHPELRAEALGRLREPGMVIV